MGAVKRDIVADRIYSRNGDDPWHYDTVAFHSVRLRVVVDSIPQKPFVRGLELACSEGRMTRLLASRVRTLVATDIAAEAIRRAREHCSGLQNVEFLVGDVRGELPPGMFDLVLCSDFLYYLSLPELRSLLRRIETGLRKGGCFVAAAFSADEARLPSRFDDVLEFVHGTAEWALTSDRFVPLKQDGDGVRVAVITRVGHPAGSV